jgi:exodeoxyribonuclease-3
VFGGLDEDRRVVGMRLRIVSWNCGMRAHDKLDKLLSLRPDVAIVQECAEPEILQRKSPDFAFSGCKWSGANRSKGLGVFSFGGLSLRRHELWDRRFHVFLPVEVRGQVCINLLAVWAFNRRVPPDVTPNPATTLDSVEHYRSLLSSHPSIVAGDFNDSVVWDKPGQVGRFAAVDSALRSIGLASVYHSVTGSPLGQEPHATLFFRKNRTQPYHIDYIYLRRTALVGALATLGDPEEWLPLSDHVPLIAEFTPPCDPRLVEQGAAEQRDKADEA